MPPPWEPPGGLCEPPLGDDGGLPLGGEPLLGGIGTLPPGVDTVAVVLQALMTSAATATTERALSQPGIDVSD